MNVGPTEILILLMIGVPIWAFIDAAIRPDAAWKQAGANKVLWMILIGVGMSVCGLPGLVLSIVYFATIRPKVKAAAAPEG